MTDTKATLAEEGLRVEQDDPFAEATARPWRYEIIGHLAYVYGQGDDPSDILFIADPKNAPAIVAAVNAYHPTPPTIEASGDLERARRVFTEWHYDRVKDGIALIERIAAEFAAIRREAAASPTQETVIEDLRDQLAQQSIDLHDAMAQLNEIENARDVAIEECARIADQSQADSMHEREISHDLETRACWLWAHDEAKQIANEIRALKSLPASPTELEKELTAALRKAQALLACNGEQSGNIDAVLAKATERGL